MSSQTALIPAAAQLDHWSGHDWQNGVVVNRLSLHDRLTVHTRNSVYEIIVTTPQTSEVLVRGGAFFPEFTPARVAGASLGGSFLKLHGVYPGFQLEIVAGGQSVITTRVRTVMVTTAPERSTMM
jgi:hypothetical protein